MAIAKPLSTITRQRVFISRCSVQTVKPGLIPILWMAVVFCVREVNFFCVVN